MENRIFIQQQSNKDRVILFPERGRSNILAHVKFCRSEFKYGLTIRTENMSNKRKALVFSFDRSRSLDSFFFFISDKSLQEIVDEVWALSKEGQSVGSSENENQRMSQKVGNWLAVLLDKFLPEGPSNA